MAARKGRYKGGLYHESCYRTAFGENEHQENVPHETRESQDTSNNVTNDAGVALEMLAEVLTKPLAERLSKLESRERDETTNNATLDEGRIIQLIHEQTAQRVELHNIETNETRDLGVQHKQFADLLKVSSCRMPSGERINVWLSGPAGTGKTYAAHQISKALDLEFYFCGALAEPYSLLGYNDANGRYVRTQFREAYENGGIFLFDEVDASEPVAVMPFNAALANGHCAFPDRVVERHKDCLIIASANTWGHGATNDYVGRLKLDGAFLDRFISYPWSVDENLERETAGNPQWTARVQQIRRNVAAKGIKVLVTPRASYYGASLLSQGFPQDTVETLVLRRGMTDEQWNAVKG